MDKAILVLNAGSSSIKFALFTCADLKLLYQGKISALFDKPQFVAYSTQQGQIINESVSFPGYESCLAHLFDWFSGLPHRFVLSAVGHRVVHGGAIFQEPCLINEMITAQIDSLTPLAPLHQPLNVMAINTVSKLYPTLPQVACFDTSFHHTQEKLATLFAIPRELTAEGVVRYGFHGISYEYIASVLPKNIGPKVIVAHLGNGASLCAMHDGNSMASSMGFTALDGLMMGSRCGTIDPGVLLYLQQEKMYTVKEVNDLLYYKSGLLGVSEISSDIQDLEFNPDPRAIEAVDLFSYRVAQEMGSLLSILQGCNAIIFTAGIGENSAVVRKKVCERLHWLGVRMDEEANLGNHSVISTSNSAVFVGVIPTKEELMIAKHAMTCLLRDDSDKK
ncbi:acetate/propionate family kinase [Legionella lytica]|uniref:Acetate kinase n=1 Tax=Legionella lytica TaxID=96232 RepID=A0ABW8D834_9GAMM